ncbi:hypothetical protein T03_9306 [Trichinella britovi]|uniref:Uncharacterized protein n=1 Tax=Trichinella britovi TaxID=45882 RepID=A0A0V1CBQ8_TRIBR|nr:hypothetical protein T03_9306 [Trichinella britovi]
MKDQLHPQNKDTKDDVHTTLTPEKKSSSIALTKTEQENEINTNDQTCSGYTTKTGMQRWSEMTNDNLVHADLSIKIKK